MLLSMSVYAKKASVGTFSDWNDLDYIEIAQLIKAGEYTTLYIVPVDESNVQFPEKDDNKYPALVNALANFRAIIQREFFGKYKNLRVVLSDGKVTPGDKELVLAVKIEDLNMGERALRAFVGFGAGSQSVQITATLSDKNGKVYFLKQRRLSTKMTSYQSCLEGTFAGLSEDMVSVLKYMK
ncbi:MAG: DUF4410 domain-containing protein [Paludibacteraceae bacterium]|nr:DUF4410 domain-containing protein [Paludibacteraceae bacterium]